MFYRAVAVWGVMFLLTGSAEAAILPLAECYTLTTYDYTSLVVAGNGEIYKKGATVETSLFDFVMKPVNSSTYNVRSNLFMWNVVTSPTYPSPPPAGHLFYLSSICGDSLRIRTVAANSEISVDGQFLRYNSSTSNTFRYTMKHTSTNPSRTCYVKVNADGSIQATDDNLHPRKQLQRFPVHNAQYDFRLQIVPCY